MDLYQVCSNYAPGAKWLRPRCHQGHGQFSTDTYMSAFNKTLVSDLGPLGPLVLSLNAYFYKFLQDSVHVQNLNRHILILNAYCDILAATP